MTDKQLEKLDIHKDSSRLNPKRYWCNTTQTHMILSRDETYKSILEMIYDRGTSEGIEEGKSIRSRQIRDMLNC